MKLKFQPVTCLNNKLIFTMLMYMYTHIIIIITYYYNCMIDVHML